ncbi:MAG: Holliday junction branch migration DNA helicase RuvB [bacterium]|nr:Holliday junction branch migration DNA helicase RuvB [bacterium]
MTEQNNTIDTEKTVAGFTPGPWSVRGRMKTNYTDLNRAVPGDALRPQQFADFVGQDPIIRNLGVMIAAAKQRGEKNLDPILFSGPQGLGKTTLSGLTAAELGGKMIPTSGPVLQSAGELAEVLVQLEAGDVLFVDEVHRVHPRVQEVLYSALEDGYIDLMAGGRKDAKPIRVPLEPFTFIAATTRPGALNKPLYDRLRAKFKLDFYSNDELALILDRAAGLLGVELGGASVKLAVAGRGTPRIALNLLRRVRDFLELAPGRDVVDVVDAGLAKLGIHPLGLDWLDLAYLRAIAHKFDGGPVGLDTLADCLGEESDVLADTIEPYLLRCGFVKRTGRGRVITDQCAAYLEALDG